MGVFSRMFSGRYNLVANTLSGAILFLIGDSVEQTLEIRAGASPQFDLNRLARIGVVGLSEGPTHVLFYHNLDRYLPNRDVKTVGKKILADQMIACPVFNFQFFFGMSLLEGKKITDCWSEFTRKFPTVYVVDWCVWPALQFVNFYFIPNRYRVLYINGVTVVWNVFLSYMKHYDQMPPKPPT